MGFENTVSYKFDIKDKHNFDVLLGMSAEKSGIGEKLNVSNKNSIFDDFEHAYIDNANFIDKANTTISGSPFTPQRLLSYFGRINYDYKIHIWQHWYCVQMALLILLLIKDGDISLQYQQDGLLLMKNLWRKLPNG